MRFTFLPAPIAGYWHLKDRAIGAGLLFGFLLLISILVGADYLGLSTMRSLHEQLQSISDNQWMDVQLATEALNRFNQNSRIIMRMIATADPAEIQGLLRSRADNSAAISVLLERLTHRIASPQEQRLYDAIVQARAAYLASSAPAISDLSQGKNLAQAAESLTHTTIPLWFKYQLAWSDFIQFQAQEMHQQLAATSASYAAARRQAIYLMLLSILLALYIALVVLRRTAVDIHRREAAEQNVQQLNQELEQKVLQRTAALQRANQHLIAEVAQRERTEQTLLSKTAFLESQTNSMLDGLLVVDANKRILFRNPRFIEILRIPPELWGNDDGVVMLKYVVSQMKRPEAFLEKIEYLYKHPDETSRDELELKNGTIIDRCSSPVIGNDGTYYGRIWIFHDITERRRHEEVVRRLSLAIEQSPVSIVITDLKGDIIYVNRRFVECTGYRAEEVIGKNPRILKSGHTTPAEYRKLWETIKAGKEWRGEFHNRKKNGQLYWEATVIRPITDEDGNPTHYLAMREDITERKILESALQQAQKMEAVGRLAGGVAHDFNNILSVITGYSELLKLRSDLDPAALHQIDGIHAAAKKAASLIQQLLAFSRKQIVARQTLDLNEVLTKLSRMLRRLIGDDIELTLRLSTRGAFVKIDPSQIDQVILNLAVNARDAMPNGGKLMIETDVCDLDASHQMGHKPVVPGRYVRLTITDSGCGMNQETMSHLFEPFFTTKELGRGTGLGLSIVYGIITQSDGYVWVYSEPAKGTSFKVYLPLLAAGVTALPPSPHVDNFKGSETILLVEDDSELRSMVFEFLSGLGYSVLQAENGERALAVAASLISPPDVLITDIVMPRIGGRELADQLISRFRNLKVLYISGYTHDGVVQTRALGTGELFLQKPFALSELSKKLREVLERENSKTAQAPS